jgi:hypothetical protein
MFRGFFPIALLFAAPAAAGDLFRAGAARLDITPPAGAALPMSGYAGREAGFQGIHDPLYFRALVFDDGSAQAALVTADLSAISHRWWERMTPRLARETGIPREHILLAATHTHAGPALGYLTDDPDSRLTGYTATLEEQLVAVVKSAQAGLRPARIGYGAGKVNVNVNRRAPMAGGGLWLGRNPDGPSDKTLGVLKIETPAGAPVAIFMNYGVHATVLSARNFQISGDLAGAASRYVEAHYGAEVVATWSSGAGGDQAPIYNQAVTFDEVQVIGRLIGEEAIQVARSIRMSPYARIRAAQKVITCAGKKAPPGPRRSRTGDYVFLDADPVDIRLSLLLVGHTAFAGVSGEVLTGIGQRLKRESPLAHTMMVTHCNGSSGYIPDDAAYDQVSYEIVSARVKKGCAEEAIVSGFLDLMDAALR